MAEHPDLVGTALHVPGYVQSADPGAVGAGKYWVDTTGGTGAWVLKVRNAANTGWEPVASGGGSALTVREVDGTPTETPTTAIEFPNGTLTEPSAGVVRYTPSGGGGATISDGAFSGRPAGAEGDLNLPSDGYSIARKGASAWEPWGPVFPLTKPPLVATWTWVNQGTATAVDEADSIYFATQTASGNNARALVRAAPATPYVVTACFYPLLTLVNSNSVGLCFRESSTGKLVSWVWTTNGAGTPSPILLAGKYASPTVYSANYQTYAPGIWGAPIWLRIADNGTNRLMGWSTDGRHWIDYHTIGRTDFLTGGADQVGLFAEAVNLSYSPAMNLVSWKVT